MVDSDAARHDAWIRWGTTFIVLSILCLLAGIYLLDMARPQTANLFDKRWDAPVRADWDMSLARVGGGLVASAAGAAAIGLLVRALLGTGAGHDARARALMGIGAIAIVATLWIRSNGPF